MLIESCVKLSGCGHYESLKQWRMNEVDNKDGMMEWFSFLFISQSGIFPFLASNFASL